MTQVKWRDYSAEFPEARRVGTRALRDNLSRCIELASNGSPVVVTRHGIVVGELSVPSDCTSILRRENREHHSEIDLVARLTEAGFRARRQVRLSCGRADIVVYANDEPWAVVELKLALESEVDRAKAVRQVTRYADELQAPLRFVAAREVCSRLGWSHNGVRICQMAQLSVVLTEVARA